MGSRTRAGSRVQAPATMQAAHEPGLGSAGRAQKELQSISHLRANTVFYEVFAIVSQRQGWEAEWESQRYLMEEIFRGKRHMAS